MSWIKVAPLLWQREPRGWVFMAYMKRCKPVLRYFLDGGDV